ncbi:hypothetical protein X797_010793 [Metarhizium robertsii]|uniref:Uncharacterized protein n=1 Tax=Metarhizium robertsii TaxID=568076 RepID=A0A014QTE0_9HYPO|nr:hypothetical protein X797_010793 [Metarhizium robertsii]
MTSRFELHPSLPVDVYLRDHENPENYHHSVWSIWLANPADLYPTRGNTYGTYFRRGQVVRPLRCTENSPDQPHCRAMVKLGRISARQAEAFRREFLRFTNYDQANFVDDYMMYAWAWLYEQRVLSRAEYLHGWLVMRGSQLRDTDPEDHFHEMVEQCDGIIFNGHSTEVWNGGQETTVLRQ